MSGNPVIPVIDGRDENRVLEQMRASLGGYVGAWVPPPGSAPDAVQRVFAGYVATVARALDEALPRAQLGFLDALGESRRAAQAASVPLVWRLIDDSPIDAVLPSGAAVAARAGAAGGAEPPTFIATQSISVTRARLAAMYCIDGIADRWEDYSTQLTSGFAIFGEGDAVEHALYVGHDTLFKLPAHVPAAATGAAPPAAHVILHVGLLASADPVREDLRLRWEYWADNGWQPFSGAIADLQITDGHVDLMKEGGPAAAEREILGAKSYWLRGTLSDPLVRSAGRAVGALPVVDTLRASLDFGAHDLLADAVLVDTRAIDATGPFQPFGASPVRGTTFYVGSSEVFGRPGAHVRLDLKLGGSKAFKPDGSVDDDKSTLREAQGTIAWEYYDGRTWKSLAIGDTTSVFRESLATAVPGDGVVAFIAPADWKVSTIGNDTSHFLRARLDDDAVFGAPPSFATGTYDPGAMKPPLLRSLRIAFSQVTDPTPVDHCVVANASVFQDVSGAARFTQSTFVPFVPVEDDQPALYFGFDRALPQGLVSLYVDVAPSDDDGSGPRASPFTWEYHATEGWASLDVHDETGGFRGSGVVQFIGPFDHLASEGPGGTLYRVRARLKQGADRVAAVVRGVWLNAVMASHASSFSAELLGRGTGEPRQALFFPPTRTPVLEGERLEVREWIGRDRSYESVVEDVDAAQRRVVTDPASGQVVEVWVTWQRRSHLYDATGDDRVYTLEAASGAVRFGDGRHGAVPPPGAPIVVTFRTGGGTVGNIPAGSLTNPRAALPFLEDVTNPLPAHGGADGETLAVTRLRGSERLRHRDRALAPRDYEWLATEASPAVARARCLPTTGAAGPGQRGWVTVIIVPVGSERQPQPDGELIARVRAYVGARVLAALAARVRVIGPTYQPVSVVLEVVPRRADAVVATEAELRRRLDEFLHPLSGGLDGRGWQLGQEVPLSHAAAVVAGTPGVAFARRIGLQVQGAVQGDAARGNPAALVAPGAHEIRWALNGEPC